MECERLKNLIKNWYVQVQDESMAPARMVDFMNNHTRDCSTCMADPIVEIEIKRITEIVLPPAKIPKAVRKVKDPDKQEEADTADDAAPEDVETEDTDTKTDVDQSEDDIDEDDVDLDPDEDEI
ncbi:MAG: hypothetical protein ABFS18_06445 [Thermodesulfobacteriota bacterium]